MNTDIENTNCDTANNTQQGSLLIGNLSPGELGIAENARKAGGKLFFIKINFRAGTPAKSLKVMLIENKLSKLGETIKFWPSVNEIEDDSHSFTLFIIFCTHEERETVRQNVNVDCVEKIFIKQI